MEDAQKEGYRRMAPLMNASWDCDPLMHRVERQLSYAFLIGHV